MKRVVGLVSLCIAANAFATEAATQTITLKQKVKSSHHIYKDAVKPAEEEKPTYPAWVDNLSATLAFTTNYVFRGVTQSDNLPAVQGGLTYTFPVGLYLNVWASNVRFVGTNASIEIDTIAGWAGEYGDFAYNVNVDRYNYPLARDLNYNELNSVFNYKFLQAGLSYSANVYNTHQTGIYYNGGINYDVPSQYVLNIENVNFQALMGHYSLPRAAGNSYNDYNVALSKKIKNYTLMGQWTGTNGRQHNSPLDDNQIIGTLTIDI